MFKTLLQAVCQQFVLKLIVGTIQTNSDHAVILLTSARIENSWILRLLSLSLSHYYMPNTIILSCKYTVLKLHRYYL